MLSVRCAQDAGAKRRRSTWFCAKNSSVCRPPRFTDPAASTGDKITVIDACFCQESVFGPMRFAQIIFNICGANLYK
jgi:hypothetical protein